MAQISLQTQKDWVEWMRKEFLKDNRLRLNEGSLEVGKSLSLLVNSKGTHHVESETSCVWSLMGMASDKDVLTSFDYFSHLSRQALGIGEIIIRTTLQFRESLKEFKNWRGKKLPRSSPFFTASGFRYFIRLFDLPSKWQSTSRWQ